MSCGGGRCLGVCWGSGRNRWGRGCVGWLWCWMMFGDCWRGGGRFCNGER